MREVRGRASLGPCGYLKGLQMCVKLDNHLDLLILDPSSCLYAFFHLPHVVLADPGGTCLLFPGA